MTNKFSRRVDRLEKVLRKRRFWKPISEMNDNELRALVDEQIENASEEEIIFLLGYEPSPAELAAIAEDMLPTATEKIH